MKTSYLMATVAGMVLLGAAAQAETLKPSRYQDTALDTSVSNGMQDNVTSSPVKEPANVREGSAMDSTSPNNSAATTSSDVQPQAGDDMSSDTGTMGSSVNVKLPSGKVIKVADSLENPWNRSEDLKGYDRFTFDPVNNLYVAGNGDKEFAGNWDENGNRIPKKAAPAPKKVKAKKVAKTEEEAAPAGDTSGAADTSKAMEETSKPEAGTTPPANGDSSDGAQ